jgi:hypothetical protein
MASAATVAAAAAPTALDFSPQFVAPIKAGNKVKTARILDASVKGGEPQLSGIVAALDAGPIKTIATADSECFARIIVTSEQTNVPTVRLPALPPVPCPRHALTRAPASQVACAPRSAS